MSPSRQCLVCARVFDGGQTKCPDDDGDVVAVHEEVEPPPIMNVGSVLGSYRLVKKLGEGGVGNVFAGEHVRLGRKMAIKVLHPEVATPDVVLRFFNEARAVNEIGHPNIIEIEDFVVAPNGVVYLLMELLQGEDLRQAISGRGTIEFDRIANIGRQIASALGAAHQVGIVHRDLKPDNVFLIDRDGNRDFVKVLDFGIVKFTEDDRGVTQIGTTVGTPQYMSPEQILRDRAVDARADIYSLGMLLYEALCGEPAFTSGSLTDVLRAQVLEPVAPPSSRRRTAVPPALEAAVMKCLEKDPDHRFSSMAEVAAALASDQPVATVTTRPRSKPRRVKQRNRLLLALPLVAMMAGTGVLLTVDSATGEREQPQAKAPAPPVVEAPAAATTITVELRSTPESAELMLGEARAPLGIAPTRVDLPLSSAPVTIVARFADGRTVSQIIVPDRELPPIVFELPPQEPAVATQATKVTPPRAAPARKLPPPAPKPTVDVPTDDRRPDRRRVREGTLDPFKETGP